MILPVHRKIREGCSEDIAFFDLLEEVAELHIARRDCLRKGIRGNRMNSEVKKEVADVILTAISYLSAISDNPKSVLRRVIADNVARGKYDKETVQLIKEGDGRVVESLSGVLEDLRHD